jgi:low temperature requirement protein LtrA
MARSARNHHLSARRRDGAAVSPLELFFDLVFVLAITQCSSLMASGHGWRTVGQGLLVLGVLWWSWVGYAWLTSVVDPDDGVVRLVVFVATAGMLVVALCVPQAFDGRAVALTLAAAYGVVRAAHIGLFLIASEDDPGLRRSVLGLAVGTVVGVALVAVAAVCEGWPRGALWLLALLIDMGVPFTFGSEGWHLEPHHFMERHGLIVIIALGESIVALGVGAEVGVTPGVVVAAVLGVSLAAAMWWTYFDVGSLLAGRRLTELPAGKEQNEMARDAYSFLHFPIVAGVVLAALGLEHVLSHVTEPLDTVPAFALGGGVAVFLLGQVAFKRRATGMLGTQRLLAAAVSLASSLLFLAVDAWLSVALAALVVWALVVYELFHYAQVRAEIRAWDPHGEA